MSIRRCVVSTVGTSLVTNRAAGAQLRQLRDSANLPEAELPPEVLQLLDDLMMQVDALLATASVPEQRRASAELNGIHGLYGGQMAQGRQDLHFLLGTDTAQGRRTAEALARHLRQQGVAAEPVIPPQLSTRSTAAFTAGVGAVVRWCEDTLEGFRQAGYRIIFNLVGSFKSLQGYLSTIGMFYADEIIYIFEAPTADLIRIPRLPLALDTSLLEQQPERFALLADGLLVGMEELAGWPEALYTADEQNQAMLSTWGLLLWQRHGRPLLSQRLLNWPGLVVAESFRRDFEGWHNQGDRIRLQEALATVTRMLLENGGDTAALKRHGGLQYDNYSGKYAGIGHFRVSQGLRVSCTNSLGGLVLHRFGKEEEVNARPR